ncbi:hypothetical protein SAMN05421753_121101 [Planctomicrobium piriforme]|uniref:Uncharacterized protein n=1 Tax=Planctomicrobium piriforme TaxID=1576369 RepID=A0A1I3RUR0_9PLAN|nr:hypothetical protein SAMN05421753_121101 [Planctomicrobium piriforme]
MITKSLPWILLLVCLMAWAVDHYRLQKSLDDVSKLDAYLAERERESAALLQLPPDEARSQYFQTLLSG